MKKITMVVLNKEREDFLVNLRRIGVVHIKSLARPAGQDIVSVEENISQIKKTISILSEIRHPSPPALTSDETALVAKAREITSKQDEIDELEKKVQDIKNSIVWFKPWGTFNPEDLTLLKDRGINIKLYALNKSEFKNIQGEENIYLISKEGKFYYVAGLFSGEERQLPFSEIKPPQENFSELEALLSDHNKKIEEAKDFITEQAIYKPQLNNLIKKLEKKHRFLEVFYGMKHEDGFSLLQGFSPVTEVNNVISLAQKHNIGYLVEEPDEPGETPTLIRNPPWLRIVEPVFRFLNTSPGYNEFDISPVFLVFFSIFFAMIVGDGAYGFVFLGLTWFARRKLKNVPPEPFRLLYLLGIATVIWGAITGTWFGFEGFARLPILNALIIDRINSFGEANENFMIYICFVIGLAHLSIAHFMRFLKTMNSIQSVGQLGWIFILIGLFFVAGTLVVDRPFPHFAKQILIIGLAVVLLFSNFQKNIIKGILITLKDVPLAIAGSFGDIVSYLRLFAVGSASLAVATSFNSMAISVGFDNVIRGLFASLILFFAHGLNITLGCLGVIVHGIRLNMLEFSGHLGIEWSGNRYSPFREE